MRFFPLILAASCGLTFVAGSLHVRGLELYVSVDGRDDFPGTSARPFATLEAARNAIRRLDPVQRAGNTIVWIKGGTYRRDRSFELTAQDSGRPDARISYRAETKEAVRLLCGQVVTNFQSVQDPTILARLSPTARAHVMQSDLRALGISQFGQMRSRGFGRPTVPAALELFCDGRPMTLARWPNTGAWEMIAGFPAASSQGDEHGGNIGDLRRGFNYAGDRPGQWQRSENIWVHGYWAWDWANSYERVETIDASQHHLQIASPYGLYGYRKGQRFYFLNVLEELDEPGEWFLDVASARLYFWPPGSADQPSGPLRHEVVVSLLEAPAITMTDVSHVSFEGLAIEAPRGHGIRIEGGGNNRIVHCAIRLAGDYGVWIEGGSRHGVVGCEITDTGDGGVNLAGGDRQTLTAGGHYVEDCHFQNQGRWSKCYVPAVLISGVGQRVSHNLIHDHPHCAILFSGNDHLIEANEIHHVALETGDVGAIYAGRDWTYRGNQIRHNFIHHTGGVGMGSMGVYMDDCVSGTEIYGNVFYKVTRAAFLGGGRDHRVENNIFVDCDPAVQLDGRGLDPSPVWHSMVYDYMRKQLNGVPLALYQMRYPALGTVAALYQSGTNGIPPEWNRVAHNICVGGTWLSVGWRAQSSMIDLHDNYVGPDPGFTGPEDRKFELSPDSPAWKSGFEKIPLNEIGIRHSSPASSTPPTR